MQVEDAARLTRVGPRSQHALAQFGQFRGGLGEAVGEERGQAFPKARALADPHTRRVQVQRGTGQQYHGPVIYGEPRVGRPVGVGCRASLGQFGKAGLGPVSRYHLRPQ